MQAVTSALAPMRSLRNPFFAAGVLALLSIAVAGAVRLSGMTIHVPDAAPVLTRSLQFLDRSDGGIDVVDVRTNQLVETVTGEAGFVRGTLRALSRERKRSGIDGIAPFELIVRADGRLTLLDPATGQRIDLESFGPDNEAAFVKMLPGRERRDPTERK